LGEGAGTGGTHQTEAKKVTLPEISTRAAAKIRSLVDRNFAEAAVPWVATVSWGYETPEVDCPRTLGIGEEEAAKVPAESVRHAHGVSLAFYFSDGDLAAYADHVLDYFGGQFVFVPKRLSQFVGAETE
jgi:hypothetical protein